MNLSYEGIRIKSNIMKKAIGKDSMRQNTTRMCHFLTSFFRSEFSPWFREAPVNREAWYPEFIIFCSRTCSFVRIGSNVTRAFSDAKFTYTSWTQGIFLRDFSISSAQLVQCIPEISNVDIFIYSVVKKPFTSPSFVYL